MGQYITFLTADPFKDLKELAHISYHLRRSSIRWHEHFGSMNRDRMRYWEEKMDKWIADHLKPETGEVEIGGYNSMSNLEKTKS